jgi:hypothetical protein
MGGKLCICDVCLICFCWYSCAAMMCIYDPLSVSVIISGNCMSRKKDKVQA